MQIKKIIVATFFFSALFSSCSTNKETKEAPKAEKLPNIVLFMGDDHGWDEVGYNGHPHIKTPVLDEMAAKGLRLDRFYSGHPSCSPTRGSFMTGRHPNRYGTFSPNWSIRPEEISVAHILSKAGYASAQYGKWHLGPVKKDSPTSPGAMGFDEWLSHDNFFEMDPILSRNGETPEQFKGEGSQIVVDEAIKFIEKSNKSEKPFFIVVWYGSPHEPYSGLPEDLATYNDLPEEYANQTVKLTSNETGERVERPLRDVLQERYAEITAMDRSIGVMRDYLKKEGLSDNTILWYCGDNGTPTSAARTGMTLRAEKGSVYEGGIRVPAVIEWPSQIKSARATTHNAVTSDILPTLCELVGQPLPNRPLDGISLVPMMNGTKEARDDPMFFWLFESNKVFNSESEPYIENSLQEGTVPLVKKMNGKYTRTFRNLKYPTASENHTGGERTIMDDQYKLVIGAKPGDATNIELFDITNDPSEQDNLVSTHPEITEKLQKQLYDWQQSVLKSLTGADY
ncbi:MAG: arylsulfatase A-like enzyme [Cyclobacteriaceae bacterium]|jgi:arylsulfatase A-like enzyme